MTDRTNSTSQMLAAATSMQHEKTVRAMFMGHEIVARNLFGLARGEIINEAVLMINDAIVDRSTELSAWKTSARFSKLVIHRSNL